jgi:phosphatidate cytidylyltransferase
MEITLYIILVAYFILGGIIIAVVNRKKDSAARKNNWVKYGVYLLIVNGLFVTILLWTDFFSVLCGLTIALGLLEIIGLTVRFRKIPLGILSLVILSGLSFFFYKFSFLPSRYLFYTLFLTTVFDSFSQLSGQLFGKRKLVPRISPQKTYEGLFGGLTFALITAALIHPLLSIGLIGSLGLGLGLAGAAFVGDLLASLCKRKFGTKDYSHLIPGHGGVLDRFDSFIATGAFMFFVTCSLGI